MSLSGDSAPRAGRSWEIPALGAASHRSRAWVPCAVASLLGLGAIACWDVANGCPLPLSVLLGLPWLVLVPAGLCLRWHGKRQDSITRRLVVTEGEVALIETCRGRARESRIALNEIRGVRQKRFQNSYCWGAEILGRGQVSLRVETPWPEEEVAAFVREIKTTLWKPGDPRAARP